MRCMCLRSARTLERQTPANLTGSTGVPTEHSNRPNRNLTTTTFIAMLGLQQSNDGSGIDIGIAVCYAAAFASIIPHVWGLYGEDGVLPFSRYFGQESGHQVPSVELIQRIPTFLWFAGDLGLPYEVMAHAFAVMGFLLSVAAALQPSSLLLLAIWLLHLGLVVSG